MGVTVDWVVLTATGITGAASAGLSGAGDIDAHVGGRIRMSREDHLGSDDFRFDLGGWEAALLSFAASAPQNVLALFRSLLAPDRFEFECPGDDPGGTGLADSLSLVTPGSPTLTSYTVAGRVVYGTDVGDTIRVGSRAEQVFGGLGNDILVWDPDTGGEPGMRMLNGQGGADTYVIGATTNQETAVSMPGCLITGFQGPGVSSRDRVRLDDFDAATVTARFEGGFVHFQDRTDHLYLDFRDQNYDPLTPEQIASVTRFSGNLALTAADFFII